MATVNLKDLVKIYPPSEKNAAFTAVKGINLEIHDGEFMVLVGPSGCGKSTTLRMIAGLEEISSGTISIDGRVVNDVLPKDRDIAMVFQNYALYPHMSVYENMAFGLKLRDLPKIEIDGRVREAAAMLGLEALLDRKPKALSGGQRQRVAVGRAIVRKPKVFLFDEPLSNLDAKMRVSMRTEIARLHDRLGATMIYVTHDQVEAMTMGDRICVMKDGEIKQVAEPLSLYNQPANLYTAAFIGSPPMNIVLGRLEGSNGQLEFVEIGTRHAPLRLKLAPHHAQAARLYWGRSITLGIRPEHLAVLPPGPNGEDILARVDLVELMGADTHLHAKTDAHSIVARVPPSSHYKPGTAIALRFDPEKMHLFDSTTGQSLR
jgi:multiple sugar transport system ATP-binding protein